MPYKKIAFGTSYGHWRYVVTKNTCAIHHDMSSWHKGKKINKLVKAAARAVLPQSIYINMKIKNNMAKIGQAQANHCQ